MPPTRARPHPVDLLLCGHHYRVSRAALAAAGAVVFNDTGEIVEIVEAGVSERENARGGHSTAAPGR